MRRWLWSLALLVLVGGHPMGSEWTAHAQSAGRTVSINQVGYLPDAPKYGMLAGTGDQAVRWSLLDAVTQTIVAEGTTASGKLDEASGDWVLTADFSSVTTPGAYILVMDEVRSVPFRIGSDLYRQLKVDALRYFYLNRSGIALDEQYAGSWSRPAGHLSDGAVTCFQGWDAEGTQWDGCDYTLNARGGWYDAGDYGKYVVNGGIAVWTLHNLYERLPDAFGDSSLTIPESGNGVPDILDEARWEMDFLLAMQVPDGQLQAGMVHHKLHDERWSGIPLLPPTMVDNHAPGRGRSLMPPSTAATLNLAATAAQCARIWQDMDAAFAERCLQAAKTAWRAANDNPIFVYGNIPGQGGGNYDDPNVDDEFYWAAAELFITTREDEYREFVKASPFFQHFPGGLTQDAAPMNWGSTAALGTISLALLSHCLSDDEIAALQGQIVEVADRSLAIMGSEGYRVSLRPNVYYWGSNSDVLNNAIILALAYDFTGDARYLHGVAESMDYLLGRNALAFSFITGYGTNVVQHPHHRFWANQPEAGFPPPPPGVVAGGPNANPTDPVAQQANLMKRPPARRYLDDIGSWSTNEVTINWNAPLVWVAAYLDAQAFR
ncbi:MAG: glycoside hydrolase family 9 protein [Chloroflexi bacterium]|nr:glycoside hydrolase family 9 protein [Chloroflexota bacterium]